VTTVTTAALDGEGDAGAAPADPPQIPRWPQASAGSGDGDDDDDGNAGRRWLAGRHRRQRWCDAVFWPYSLGVGSMDGAGRCRQARDLPTVYRTMAKHAGQDTDILPGKNLTLILKRIQRLDWAYAIDTT